MASGSLFDAPIISHSQLGCYNFGRHRGTVIALRNCVNQTNSMNTTHESTYALLVRSEEKERGLLETVLYAFFILSAVAAIWQFAQQPVNIPARGIEASPCLACQSQSTQVDSRS
jgi:hypothetical protein